MSHSRKRTLPLDYSSSKKPKVQNTNRERKPNFFRTPLPLSLLRYNQKREDYPNDNTLFDFSDLSSKAKLARTCHLFSDIPEYKKALRQFDKLVKIFFEFVLDGRCDEVALMLEQYPELHFAKCKFEDEEGIFYRTAYQLALGQEDVGREGCDLYLSNNPNEETSHKQLALYSDEHPQTPFSYKIRGRIYTIESGYESNNQLSPEHFATLKAMFANPALANQNLNLSSKILTEAQYQAYAALLKITSNRNHTLFVKEEEGMAELIRESTLKQPKGLEEITRRTEEQFPEGWEAREEERAINDRQMLERLTDALFRARNPDWEAVLPSLKNHFKSEIRRSGKHFNGKILADIFEIWEPKWADFGGYIGMKNKFFADKIIGYLESIAPAHYRQAIAQGMYYIIENGERLKRSEGARHGQVYADQASSNFCGSFWIDIFGVVGGGGCWEAGGGRYGGNFFHNYVRAKKVSLQKFIQPQESRNQKNCVIL